MQNFSREMNLKGAISVSVAIKKKRVYLPPAKPGELKVGWGRLDWHSNPSLVYDAGGDGAPARHCRILMDVFEGKNQHHNLTSILTERGYDLTTLKFSIFQKAEGKVVRLRKSKKANTRELEAYWGLLDQEPQLCYAWGENGASRSDATALRSVFEEWDVNNLQKEYIRDMWAKYGITEGSLVPELEPSQTLVEVLTELGYDLSTWKFSIRLKTDTEL